MRASTSARLAATLLAVATLAACSSGSSGSATAVTTASGPVKLTYWSWAPNMDKIVATWNAAHPEIQVEVTKPAQGDALVTKILAATKAGNGPDLMQAEYQALPTLVTNGAVADITKYVTSGSAAFADGAWSQVTFGTKRYGVPQDIGQLMFFYRKDLFAKYGLTVPTTWDEYAADAKKLHAANPKVYLGGFSAGDPGLFSGLAAQAGGKWWNFDGTNWSVGVNDAGTKKVADFWSGLTASGDIDTSPWWTPEWNKKLNTGQQISWISAVWAPGVLTGSAPDTNGKWGAAALPQWTAGATSTGYWGGSSTAISTKSAHPVEAAKFALWLNSDPAAAELLVTQAAVYPASTAGQSAKALSSDPAIFASGTNFYPLAKQVASTATGFTWGPDVNVTYQSFKDTFGKAVTGKSAFSAALDTMQAATVADMKKSGFTRSGS